ncbi:MAG: hypothetical protein JWM59_774, partial [Verrucomicrobiales bacterium]|nr:hypothetical protein [Verrucomicrobiales bacterium]
MPHATNPMMPAKRTAQSGTKRKATAEVEEPVAVATPVEKPGGMKERNQKRDGNCKRNAASRHRAAGTQPDPKRAE